MFFHWNLYFQPLQCCQISCEDQHQVEKLKHWCNLHCLKSSKPWLLRFLFLVKLSPSVTFIKMAKKKCLTSTEKLTYNQMRNIYKLFLGTSDNFSWYSDNSTILVTRLPTVKVLVILATGYFYWPPWPWIPIVSFDCSMWFGVCLWAASGIPLHQTCVLWCCANRILYSRRRLLAWDWKYIHMSIFIHQQETDGKKVQIYSYTGREGVEDEYLL